MVLWWNSMSTIILGLGGGNDLGDAYGFRYEKDDNLKLTAVKKVTRIWA